MIAACPPRRFNTWLALAVITCTLGLPSAKAQVHPAWPPVPPEEVALKDNAFEPGAPALILEYQVQTDNAKSTETTYKRIKIFREEGKKFADVEIRYFEKFTRVEEIQARVTSPSGKSEDFSGTIYDKDVVKLKKFRYSAKTFTLPNIEIGAVIEYSYRLHWHSDIPDVFKHPSQYLIREAYAYPAAQWEIQQDIGVRHARFTLHPIKGAPTQTYARSLPKDSVQVTLPDGGLELEVNYIPAFQAEEYSPPEENLKVRGDVYYTLGMYGLYGQSSYWQSVARQEAEYYDKFIGKPKDVQDEVQRIISPGDSDETKLQKIYARIQQIRALSYEPDKSKKERKQESLTENKNAEEVLRRGYAFANEMNLAFIALARAAGLQVYPFRVAARNGAFFDAGRLDPNQLNALVVEITIGSTSRFVDPATLYCPDRFLPWEETDAGGIRVDRRADKMEKTPIPESKDAIIRREAEFHLDAEGNLDGKLAITYEGREALGRRLAAIELDETERRKQMEEEVQHLISQGGTVKLLSIEGWKTPEAPLKAQFEVQVPNYASRAGERLLVPVGVFQSGRQHPFASSRRTNPVYFRYPAESYDDVTLTLPANFQVESRPAYGKSERGFASYESSAEKEGNALRLKRVFKMKGYYFLADKYQDIRQFYERVRYADEQQATLKPIQSQAK